MSASSHPRCWSDRNSHAAHSPAYGSSSSPNPASSESEPASAISTTLAAMENARSRRRGRSKLCSTCTHTNSDPSSTRASSTEVAVRACWTNCSSAAISPAASSTLSTKFFLRRRRYANREPAGTSRSEIIAVLTSTAPATATASTDSSVAARTTRRRRIESSGRSIRSLRARRRSAQVAGGRAEGAVMASGAVAMRLIAPLRRGTLLTRPRVRPRPGRPAGSGPSRRPPPRGRRAARPRRVRAGPARRARTRPRSPRRRPVSLRRRAVRSRAPARWRCSFATSGTPGAWSWPRAWRRASGRASGRRAPGAPPAWKVRRGGRRPRSPTRPVVAGGRQG